MEQSFQAADQVTIMFLHKQYKQHDTKADQARYLLTPAL